MSRILFGSIMAALIVWGLFHAAGAYLFNHNPMRAVVVIVSFALFLGFWLFMLNLRRRKSIDRE